MPHEICVYSQSRYRAVASRGKNGDDQGVPLSEDGKVFLVGLNCVLLLPLTPQLIERLNRKICTLFVSVVQ